MYQKKTNIMASNLFKRYIWLADTIHRYGPITLAEIRARWQEDVARFTALRAKYLLYE